MSIYRTGFDCNRNHVKASFYLNECSITFMKDWILRKIFLSTGRKFIPVGEKNDIFSQSKGKLYFQNSTSHTWGLWSGQCITIQAFALSTLLQGLKEKNNVSYQLVIWASCSHILFAQGHFCLSLVMILLEDEVPRPLPIGQVSFNSLILAQQENLLVPN